VSQTREHPLGDGVHGCRQRKRSTEEPVGLGAPKAKMDRCGRFAAGDFQVRQAPRASDMSRPHSAIRTILVVLVMLPASVSAQTIDGQPQASLVAREHAPFDCAAREGTLPSCRFFAGGASGPDREPVSGRQSRPLLGIPVRFVQSVSSLLPDGQLFLALMTITAHPALASLKVGDTEPERCQLTGSLDRTCPDIQARIRAVDDRGILLRVHDPGFAVPGHFATDRRLRPPEPGAIGAHATGWRCIRACSTKPGIRLLSDNPSNGVKRMLE
jgi:hypothetical protein